MDAISSSALVLLLLMISQSTDGKSLSLTKRAAFYIANGTVCNVDGVIYQNNEKIPTDNPCESCYCRPPGFACVLKDCELKPHCKAVRREGQCCPDYHCDGCEHDGQFYADGQVIPNTGSPCYTCYCQGASITCSLVSCTFRNDCAARYNPGECCPRYEHCSPKDANTRETLQPATLPTTLFQSRLTRFKNFDFPPEFPARAPGQGEVFPRSDENRPSVKIPPPVRPNFYLTDRNPGSKVTSPTNVTPVESSARTSEEKTSIFVDTTLSAQTTSTTPSPPRVTGSTARSTPPIEVTTRRSIPTTDAPTTTTTTAKSTTTTTTTTTTSAPPTTGAATPPPPTTTSTSTTTAPPSTSSSTSATTSTTIGAPPPPTTTAPPTESSRLPPTTAALTDLPDKDLRHISEDDVTRIDDVTQKLTAVTKSIFRKATSSDSTQIADWELEEFRRAVELLETHYRNFYDKAANVSTASRPRTVPAELRERSTYITQDMIDALFAGQKIPVAVEDDTQPPPTTPMPPQKSGEEVIVPEFRPLLGEDDIGPSNITEEEALRLLRETLESDSANRSRLVEQKGTTVVGFAGRSASPKDTQPENQVDGENSEGPADDSSSIQSSSTPPQCNLTRQLTSLLETLSMRSRSHDPILDFLKRAIHSHTVMHPDDVKHFMRKTI
ncbi:uncharacterized protein PB18E9.04c [Galendromus occidentalis]|uniref:Uncharacterized protein PB18E9.04c n=1 Tax=Galendromus occidentalis TaxID=34638 RepID=A0AAJ7SHK5_9ACAR|nr:uncharacterized protein PB18E9.04c [Galendromus occidentalis]